ncbi:MAG: hypothetical protein RBR77_04270 [Thauera sp.]|jgi:hypothetical protein|nr:hypothetical protein [Thauera sp.]
MNTNTNTNTAKLALRIYNAACNAAYDESDKYGRYIAARRAIVRAIRRELGLPKHGFAPVTVFNAASKYASVIAAAPFSEESWYFVDVTIRPKLRRMIRRAKKGTL